MKDLDTVYRQHAQTVYKFLLSQCRDPQTAEELRDFLSGSAVHRPV